MAAKEIAEKIINKKRHSVATEIKPSQHLSSKTEFKKGKPSPRKGIRKPGFTNQTSFQPRRSLWATNVREYQNIHRWMKNNFGQPNYCENCKSQNPPTSASTYQ